MDRRSLRRYADGKWGVRIRLPVHYRQSEFKRKVGSISEARRLRDEILVKVARREKLDPPPDQRRKLADLCTEWAEDREASQTKSVANLWATWAGQMYADQIERRQVQAAIDTMSEKLKPNTIKARVGVLKSIFQMAEDIGALERSQNPFRKRFSLPKVISKIEVLTPAEVRAIIAELDEYGCYAEFAVLTGFRRIEMLNLEWTDIDLALGTAHLATTKNEKPHELPLPARAVAILRSQKARYPDSQWCFPRNDGQKLTSNAHYKIWKPVFDKLGLRGKKWHTLRKANASAAVSSGVPLSVASKILNHSGVSITAGVYADPDAAAKLDALEKVSVYFFGTEGEGGNLKTDNHAVLAT